MAGTSYIVVGIIFIMTCVAISIFIYYVYYYKKDDSTTPIDLIVTDTHFANEYARTINLQNIIKNRDIVLATGQGYGITLECEMHIKNLSSNANWHGNFDSYRPVFRLGTSVQLMYNPKLNKFSFFLKCKKDENTIVYPDINIANPPLQKWFKLVIRTQDRTVDAYIDGQNVVSFLLPCVPLYNSGNVYLGESNNNFNGQVRKMKLYLYPLKID